MKTSRLRLLRLMAVLVGISSYASAQHVEKKTVIPSADSAHTQRLSTVAVDAQGHATYMGTNNAEAHQASIYVPMESVRAKRHAEIQLDGLKIREPGEPTHLSGLAHSNRYRLRVFSSSGGKLRLLPTIETFLSPLLKPQSHGAAGGDSAIEMDGSAEYINVALSSLLYSAPQRRMDDEIVFTLDPIQPTYGKRLEHRLPVVVTVDAERARARWKKEALNDSFVIHADEDTVIPLGSLSVGSPSIDNEDIMRQILLNLTIAASHGRLQLNLNTSVNPLSSEQDYSNFHVLEANDLLLHVSGSIRSVNRHLATLEYEPFRNYNGPDTIVVSIAPSPTAQSDLDAPLSAGSDLLRVFLRPIADPIQLAWAESQSNVFDMVSSASSEMLPPMQITDDDDQGDSVDRAAVAFFRYQDYLRAEVMMSRQFGFNLQHDAIAAQNITNATGSFVQLEFEGRPADLLAMLRVVHIISPRPSIKSSVSDSTAVVVRVSKVHAVNGSAYMSAEVSLNVIRENHGISAQSSYLSLSQRQVSVLEDHEVDVGHIFDWNEIVWDDAEDLDGVVVNLTTDHGRVASNGSAAELSVYQQSLTFVASSLRELLNVLSQLRYLPDLNFAGDDTLKIAIGDRQTTCWLQVTAVNDAPTLSLDDDSHESVDDASKQATMLCWFVPRIRVDDPDAGDVLMLEITVDDPNATLALDGLNVYPRPGLWIEGVTGNSISREEELTVVKVFRARGVPSVINEAFASASLIEVNPPDPGTQLRANTRLQVCISDQAGATTCQDRHIAFTQIYTVVLVPAAIQRVPFLRGVPASGLISLNASIVPADVVLRLRLSAVVGSFESVSMDNRASATCGESVEKRVGSEGNVRTVRELTGRLECFATLLGQVVYQSSSKVTAETVDVITVELWHVRHKRASTSFSVVLLPPSPRFVVSVSKSQATDSESRLWKWTNHHHALLSSFVEIRVNAIGDNDSPTPGSDYGPVLALNVSCSSSCLLSYSSSVQTPLVPHVAYTLASTELSRIQRFVGTQASLTQLLQTLEISATPASNSDTTQRDGVVELSLAETDHSLYAAARSTLRIQFRFELVEAPLQWLARHTEYRAEVGGKTGVASINGVALATEFQDLSRNVHVAIACENEDGAEVDQEILLSVDHASHRVIDQRCSPTSVIELKGTLAEINAVLAKVQIKSSRPANVKMRFAVMEDESTASSHIDVSVRFGVAAKPATFSLTRRLVNAITEAIAVNEGSSVRLWRVFSVATDDSAATFDQQQLFQLVAVVTQGVLVVPLDEICCVHIKSAINTSRLELEGTIQSLQDTLSAVRYEPRTSFWGQDRLRLAIEDPSDDVKQIEGARWTSETEIRVLPINDAPGISISQRNRKRLPSQREGEEDDVSVFQTELAITISDSDITNLPATSDGDSEQPRDDALGSILHVQLVAQDGVSAFVVPNWDTMQHLAGEIDKIQALSPPETISMQHGETAIATASLTFTASLESANAILKSVLLISSTTVISRISCVDDIDAENTLLTVRVSDLGHGVKGWQAQEAMETVSGCEDAGDDDAAGELSLSLPSERAALDTTERSLTVSGLELKSSVGVSIDDEDVVRVTGAVAFTVTPEVQRIRLVAPQQIQVLTVSIQVSAAALSVDVTAVSGTFELKMTGDPLKTATVYAQAVAMRLNEVMGDDGTGRGLTESMEGRLSVLYGDDVLKQRQIQVVKSLATDRRSVSWQIFVAIKPGETEIARLSIGATAFVATGAAAGAVTVSTASNTHAGSLGGSFSLQLGEESTRAIHVGATALTLQNALEELPSLDVVQVSTVDAYVWDVTFFQPGANVPLLRANSSQLTPTAVSSDAAVPAMIFMAASAEVSRLQRGFGQGSLYEIDVSAAPVSPVYRVQATSGSSTVSGGRFTLAFQLDDARAVVATTAEIAVDAVAMAQDEGVFQHQGGRLGSSLQSRLRAAIQQLPLEHWKSASIQTVVTRSQTATAPPTFVWMVTFVNAPADFPSLVGSTTASQPTANAVTLAVTKLTPSNAVGGFFTLSVDGHATPPIAVSASANEVQDKLNTLPSVRHAVSSSSTQFGRVVVRRRAIRAVSGASFAVLFVEQVASASQSIGEISSRPLGSLVTADGGQLTGLGAFARVVSSSATAAIAASDAMWLFPAFTSVGLQQPSSAWTNAVRGEFRPSHFELEGLVSDIRPLLRQFSCALPTEWCCGLVSVLVQCQHVASPVGDAKSEAISIRTDDQVLPFATPHDIQVLLSTTNASISDSDDVVATRGATQSVGMLQLVLPVWSRVLLRVSIRVRVQHGFVSLENRDRSSLSRLPTDALWVNGTSTLANARLKRLQYTCALSSSHAVDVLSAEVFAASDGEPQHLTLAEFLIRMEEPPLEPRIVVSGGVSQGDGDGVVLMVDDDKALVIPIFSIFDANQAVLDTVTPPLKTRADAVELTLQADLGTLSFSSIDGLPPPAENNRKLKLHGTISTLNSALKSLQYKPSDDFDHVRDTVTVLVRHQPVDGPVLTDSQTVLIHIRHVVHVPRVVIANDSVVAYASKEDDGYRFPRLVLQEDYSELGKLPSRRAAVRRPVVELRRTDLLPPLITTTKPTNADDDWRHRWVADFPGLSAASTTARTFAVVGIGASFFLTGVDQTHGEELWMSDGSSNGTSLFADLMPGEASSSPSNFAILPSSTSKLVFAADGIDRSWILDTERPCNRERLSSTDSGIQYVVAKSTTWNLAAQYDCPRQGWRWATTAEASARFRRTTSADTSASLTRSLNLSEPYVFWNSCDWKGYTFGGSVRKFFRFADSASTGALKHAGRRDSEPLEVSFATTDFAGIVCIQDEASDTQAGRELWIADSSSPNSVRRLADIEVGPRGSNPRFLTPFQSKWLLFQATTSDLGSELYKTDGSSSGTTLVEDIWPGPRSADPSDFAEWTSGYGRMYFAATTDSGRELWSTDGLSSITTERGRRAGATASGLLIGTALVRDVCAGAASSNPQFLTALGSLGVFFSATDCVNGRELWVTDGSLAGTKMVKDINPTSGMGSDPSHLVAFSGKLYFAATVDPTAKGRELFVSDGTSSGTKLLVELAGGIASAAPTILTGANGKLYFHVFDGSGAASLWSSDGTVSGTTPVWDSVFQQSHSLRLLSSAVDSGGNSDRFFVFNNALYYFTQSRRGSTASDSDTAAAAANDIFRLDVSVSHGSLRLPSVDKSFIAAQTFGSSSLTVEGSVVHIQDALHRVLYHTPLNWNVLQTPADHAVQWRFNVSSSSAAASSLFRVTTADLIVQPQMDPPVIIVPAVVEHATDSASDYLSRLRLQCLSVTVLEDVPTQLRGFSVRGVDDIDGTFSWELELSVQRGRLDLVDSAGCVKSLQFGQLTAAKRIRVVASRLSCLRRLLQSMVYTSDPHVSGSDSLTIQVSVSSPTAKTTGHSDQASVPIVITEVNDAPFLTTRSGFYYEANEDQALVLRDLRVVDPDAAASDHITVDLRVRFGSVALLYFSASSSRSSTIVVLKNESSAASPPRASSRLVLSGSLQDVNAALSSVAYTSANDWNSLAQIALGASDEDGYDIISVELSDGQSFNASTSAALSVYVSPTPDPVVILPPFVVATSVYASLEDGVLHGDEDEWLETERLAFTTVDDTSRLSLDVTVRVSHGRLTFQKTTLQEVTVSGSADDGSSWRLRGRLDVVNRTIATLQYLPVADFYGTDALEIVATAVDIYASQQSTTTTRTVPIQIHAVNDAPQWTLPSPTMRWRQDAPTRIAVVVLDDVDFHSVDCGVVGCELEVVVEATGSALLTFPRLKALMRSPQFTVSASSTEATAYIVLTGSLINLNSVLKEIVLTTIDADSLVREPVEVWFTADDKGTFGGGDPLVSRQKLTILPFQWTEHAVELLTPSDQVLATDEDTALSFRGMIRLVDRDSSSRPTANSPQYEVSVAQAHGVFRLATPSSWTTTRLLMLPSATDRALRFRGFLPQINAALNGSAYVPDADWFGSDEIHIVVREVDSAASSEPVASVISVFVAPVCDAPQWLKIDSNNSSRSEDESADVELEEDAQALLTTVSVVDVDVVEGDAGGRHRDVTASVEVLNGGGVMLATTRGVRIESEQPPQWTTPFESLRLLFFSRVRLTGCTSDVNAALRGLIYRPQPDFHTNGHVWDAIALTLTAATASCPQSSQDDSRLVLRARVHAVNDAPVVVSPRFTRLFQRDPKTADAQRLGVNAMQEAYENQELVLDAIALLDVDTLIQGDDDGDRLPAADMKLRVSCRSCSVRPSLSTETLQRDFGILTSRDDATDATEYFGSIESLNTALLQAMVFKSASQFHGDVMVVLEVSDLGFSGRGGPLTSTFVMVVRVHSVNDGPQILVPPYGTREPSLRVDELASVLLRGAPNPPQKPTAQYRRRPQTDRQQLVFVDAHGGDSTVRLRTLLDVETAVDSTGTSFYASLSPQQLLFSAFHPATGVELRTSDGTASGTRLLKDIAPGAASSYPQYLTPFSIDSRVYFAARGPNTDAWRLSPDRRDSCDGMRESAFAPGVVYVVAAQTTWDPEAVYDCPTGFQWMTTAEAQKVFLGTIQNDGHSTEPLVYYGQCDWEAFTWGGQQRTHFRFADSRATGAFKHVGHRDSYRPDVGFQTSTFAGVVCRRIAGEDQVSDAWGSELWATDGTAQGTAQVTRLGSSTLPRFLTEYQGRLFFQATTVAFGAELWASDGSRDGTQLIADVAFGPRSSSPEQLTVANGKLFFSATTDSYGRELWLSDGEPRADFAQVDHGDSVTRTGTRLVLDIRPGAESSTPLFLVALPVAALLLFQADDGVHGRELWASDGSVAGTRLVLDIHSGLQSSTPQFLTHFNGRVFFQADDGAHGAELWATDGSSANTKLLVDLATGSRGANPRYLSVLSLSAGVPSLVFAASTNRDPQVAEFWVSDGTSAGTRRLFAGSREVATPNERAMLALHKPQVVGLNRGFVYFGMKRSEPRRSQEDDWKLTPRPAAVVSRSMTLLDDDAVDSDNMYSVVLQCQHGLLSLSHREICGQPLPATAEPSSASLQLRGPLDQLNCLVAEVVYHATPSNASVRVSANSWDDVIVVTLTEEPTPSAANGRLYSTSQRIPIHVVALNHAPIIELATRIFAPLGQWMPLPSTVSVSDEDAGDHAMLFVRLSARRGRLRLVESDDEDGAEGDLVVLTPLTDSQRGAVSVEFSAAASRVTKILRRRVQYACLAVDGCVDGMHDTLTLVVDDNGFSGSGGPQATTKTASVLVLSG